MAQYITVNVVFGEKLCVAQYLGMYLKQLGGFAAQQGLSPRTTSGA